MEVQRSVQALPALRITAKQQRGQDGPAPPDAGAGGFDAGCCFGLMP